MILIQLNSDLDTSVHVIKLSIMRSCWASDENECRLQQSLWAYHWHFLPRPASLKSRPISSEPDWRSVWSTRFMLRLNDGVKRQHGRVFAIELTI